MSLVNSAGSGREGLSSLVAWVGHHQRLAAQRAIAARTIAELRVASAVYNAAQEHPESATVAWLRDRYRRG